MEGPFTIIYQDKIFDPYINLASEEFLLKKQKENPGSNILFVYRNKPSVVCGKNQSIWAEVNLKFCRENKISVNKRVSGGGTVYHDLGNLNFSYFTQRKSEWVSNFKIFNDPIIEFLNSNGVEAQSNDRNDILIDSFKISGNAQHISGDQMISHATLLYDADLKNVSSALRQPYKNVHSAAIQSKKVPVTNIRKYRLDIPMEEFIELFISFMNKALNGHAEIGFNQESTEKILKLAESKYSKQEWIYGNSPKTTIEMELPFEDQNYNLICHLEKGKVNNLILNPKNNSLIALFEELLKGEFFTHDNLEDRISKFKASKQKKLKVILSKLNL